MTSVREATDDLLAEKPDMESALREVLAVDEDADGWTFDDVPLDSGRFGELVSRDIVTKDGGEYEVADPEAVRTALDGGEDETSGTEQARPASSALSSVSASILPSVSLSRVEVGSLVAVLAFLVSMRTYIYRTVFRGEYVVLPSNDPYYYRYWVERFAVEAGGAFDFSVLSAFPSAVAKGEPLLVATLWWVTSLLGGAEAGGVVLAWYPVLSAFVVGCLVYAMAVRATGDRRVGLASVAFLAVVPAFAYRTGLGFADHHAFDYPWLAATALALVWMADVERDDLLSPGAWLAAGVLGVAVAGQVMAWEAGPLLVAAIGVYVAVRVVADVQADRSPVVTTAPILAGLALASVLAHLAHTGFGWHTDIVAYAPVMAFAGVAGVSLAAEAIRRAGMPGYVLGATEVAGGLSGLALLQVLLPSYTAKLGRRLDLLLFNSGAAETRSMFAGGPSGFFLGPILELGFVWFLGLVTLALVSRRTYRQDRPAWLVVCTYGWYFLLLASIQRRFVGELAPFFAVLAGYGFVVLTAKLSVTGPPEFGRTANARSDGGLHEYAGETRGVRSLALPDRGTVTALVVLFLFVTSAGIVQTAVRHEQVKIVDDKFEASLWMDQYAEQRGWEHPDDYVLSKWGRNRMYNYFVNGESRSYAFAEDHYEDFLASRDPAKEYWNLRHSVGFVVTKNLRTNRIPPKSNFARFHQRFGSAGENGASGAGHYRAVYASDDQSIKVFTLVPGVNVTGTASPNATVTVSKSVEIEGASFEYRRVVSAGPDGNFTVTVPYPGEYAVGNRTVTVSESGIRNGANVTVGGTVGRA